MSRIFKGNMRTFKETIKLTDKKKLCNFTLSNFFLSVSFIVSVKVRIFPLNMRNIIIYVARWWKKYRNVGHLNILVHDVINLLNYEYWTDKQKCFYVCKDLIKLILCCPKYFHHHSQEHFFNCNITGSSFVEMLLKNMVK